MTHFVASHGIYAVFLLMIAAAVVPAASELVMLVAGAIAAGAVANASVDLFGATLGRGAPSYLAMALAGVLGNTLGAAAGWWIGRRGGRAVVERYGRALHVTEEKLDRVERRFDRYESWAVPLGLAVPLLRSFVAIPAGIFGVPFVRFLALAVVGIAVFCFGLAGAGWALGHSYTTAHHDLRYVEVAVVVAVVALAAFLFVRRRKSSTMGPGADPAR